MNNKGSILFSYFRNGCEKGVNVEKNSIRLVAENENVFKFSGSYSMRKKEGYLNEDIGKVSGKIYYLEHPDSVCIIAVKSHYIGEKNGLPYDYTKTDSFEVFKNGLVYRVSQDSRHKLLGETYYKTHPEGTFSDYITNCTDPIRLNEGDHLMKKALRK